MRRTTSRPCSSRRRCSPAPGRVTTTFVASPTPVFWTTIVYVIRSPGRSVAPGPGVFDLTIVRIGVPMNVWTGGELDGLAARRQQGQVDDRVRGTDRHRRRERERRRDEHAVRRGRRERDRPAAGDGAVAEGERAGVGARGHGARPPVDDGVGVVRGGRVGTRQRRPREGAARRAVRRRGDEGARGDAGHGSARVDGERHLTVSPVTTREREAVSELKRPCGLTPGTKASAPPWLVAALNGASTVHASVAML